jgi:glycosyltransferase involved in cell wall biosynthesis
MTDRYVGRLSVIVTTYNNPRGLQLVLAGLTRQTVQDFELLIADDGSGAETAALISEFAARARFPVRHVWHPDQGFRKCTISNKAILEAEGNYLVFFDGDCIAPSHCLAAHLYEARHGSYLTGGKIPVSRSLGSRLTVESVQRGLLDGIGIWWLGVGKRRRLFVSHVPVVRDMMNRRVPRQPSWRGENSSAFASDLRRVGGFDERFTYGYEDADFGHRLQAAGVQGRSIRYTAPVFHLEHERPYVDPVQIVRNRKLYHENRARSLGWTPHGLPAP